MPSTNRTRVALVDDHAIVRDGLRQLLELSEDFEVVGQAADGVEAVNVAKSLTPDVVLMDVIMPGRDGVEACRAIMDILPDTRVLMLTASTEQDAVIQSVAAGATGYVQKFSGREELIAAIRDVADDRLHIPGDAVRWVFATIRDEPERTVRLGSDTLTRGEREILMLFASGKSYAQIAEVKGNSQVTVRNTIYGIQDKLGVRTKQEIVVWTVRNGLLDDV